MLVRLLSVSSFSVFPSSLTSWLASLVESMVELQVTGNSIYMDINKESLALSEPHLKSEVHISRRLDFSFLASYLNQG